MLESILDAQDTAWKAAKNLWSVQARLEELWPQRELQRNPKSGLERSEIHSAWAGCLVLYPAVGHE